MVRENGFGGGWLYGGHLLLLYLHFTQAVNGVQRRRGGCAWPHKTTRMKQDKEKDKKKEDEELIHSVTNRDYEYGFTTDIETDTIPAGLSEEGNPLLS